MIDALSDFGYASLGLKASDFTDGTQLIQLGYAPTRIVLLTALDGIEFEDAWSSETSAKLEEFELPMIGKEHFITNKRAVGRAKDLADIESIQGP